jgi:hypothetical protein
MMQCEEREWKLRSKLYLANIGELLLILKLLTLDCVDLFPQVVDLKQQEI